MMSKKEEFIADFLEEKRVNKKIYNAAKKLEKPYHISLYEEYIYYVPWAKKADMKPPIKIVFTNVDIEDGVVVSGVWELAIPKSDKLNRHMINNTNLQNCVFRLEDEIKCKALFCKAMLFYKPHQIKKKDQKFIDEFSEQHPEYAL